MLKNTHFSLLLLYLVLAFLPTHLSASTLHAILVADSVNDINFITQPDLVKWKSEIQLISKYAKLPVKQKVFTAKQFSKNQVAHYIQKLELKSDDSIIFYFSGHGYRTMTQKSPLPSLTFDLTDKGIELEWVVNKIREKRPRFGLIMADCCNNYIEKGFSNPSKTIQIKFHPLAPNYAVYELLFAKAKGCIVVASCSAGQFSYGSHMGGLYTQCFFASLNRELSEKKPSWRKLLRRTNGYIGHIQKPICLVHSFDKRK